MPVSTVPLVVKLIVAQLQTDSDLAGLQILYGDDSRDVEREAVVLTGAVEWESAEWAGLGAFRREEQYTLDAFVHALAPGQSQQDALERAFSLTGAVETLLRSLLQPGGAALALGGAQGQIVNLEYVPRHGIPFPAGEGRGYILDFGVRVHGRI